MRYRNTQITTCLLIFSAMLAACSSKPSQPAARKDCVEMRAGHSVFVPRPKGQEWRDTKGMDAALARSFRTAGRSDMHGKIERVKPTAAKKKGRAKLPSGEGISTSRIKNTMSEGSDQDPSDSVR